MTGHCPHRGPLVDGFWRDCSHPKRGGRCRKQVECKTCTLEPVVITLGVRAAPEPFEPDECPHRGRELTGPERQEKGLAHGKRWALCMHSDKPLGEYVCPCNGCGPLCSGYPTSDCKVSREDHET